MNFNYTRGKLGDLILQEPALSALGLPVQLYISSPEFRPLFKNHPAITCVDKPLPDGRELSPELAMTWATHNSTYFGLGYFQQLGIDPAHYRHQFRLFYELPPVSGGYICLAPFAHTDNACPGPDYWGTLLGNFRTPVVSLGGASDPEIPGSTSLRGLSWSAVCEVLAGCSLLISVETGILHLANACCQRVVFLSCATPRGFADPLAVPELAVVRSHAPNWPVYDVKKAAKKMLYD